MSEDRVDWLFLDLNSYFASVEQQLEPRWRGRPLAVVPVMTETTCAIAASYEAKAFGVKTGTMIYEARKLCPDLVLAPARHDRYVEYHHKIIAEIDRHIPVERVCSIDEVACLLLGPQKRLAAAQDLARAIKRGLAENVGPCIRCSIGLAPNAFLAKVGTNLEKPDGLIALTRDVLPGRLLDLELRDIPGIGRNMERRLREAGVAGMAALWDQGPEDLRRIWGSVSGLRFHALLHGRDLPELETARRTVGHSQVLAPEMRVPDQTRLVVRRLTMKAASRLRRLDYSAAAVGFGLRFEDTRHAGGRWGGKLRVQRTQDSFLLLQAVEALWRRMLAETGAPGLRIQKVSVTLFELLPQAETIPDLFPETTGGSAAHLTLSRVIDQINRRFGKDTVCLGAAPRALASYTGTKIAFTRIPDLAEFRE
ncbi:MAG: type VI secretion protein ImpB [Rhodovibrionaceae bacterium]